MRAENDLLHAKLDAVHMHTNLAKLEMEELQRRHNAKKSKKASLPTVTSAPGWLTSVQGKELHQQQEVVRSEKKRKKVETAARKGQEELEKQERRRTIVSGGAAGFTCTISSKRVGELRDIAYALGLEDKGTKEHLTTIIKAHFEANPASKQEPLFVGMFSAARRQKRCTPTDVGDENPSPSNLPHTEAPASVLPSPRYQSPDRLV